MVKVLSGLIVALVIVLAGGGYALRNSMAKANALSAQNNALTARVDTLSKLRSSDAKALKVSRAAQAALTKEKAAQDEALTKALAANPAWADGGVPDAVVDALGLPR